MNALETKTSAAISSKPAGTRPFGSMQIEGLIFLSFALAFLLFTLSDLQVRLQISYHVSHFWGNYLRYFFTNWLFNPGFYAAAAITIVLTTTIPARRDQKILDVALLHDGLWILLHISMSVLFLPICIAAFHSLCQHCSFAMPIEKLPVALRWVIAFLIGDFIAYCAHVWRHKSRVLWQFHAVHHSQNDLNFFSESRRHPVDHLIVYVRLFLPFFFFHLPLEAMAATYVVRRWHERIYHSNIKTNLGFFRYIIVTPQSHRVHHSIESRHKDKNFGDTLSIWDHLFGTQYRNYDEYPHTGIEDYSFPREQDSATTGLKEHCSVLFRQLLHPFKAIVRS